VSIVFYAPAALVLVVVQGMPVTAPAFLLILTSGALHLGYFVLLNRGYRVGDLSLVYPLARGSGPLLATIAAIVLLRERPSPVALLGVFLIVGSAIVLTGNPRRLLLAGAGHAVAFALMTGALIAAYTLVDKEAVSAVLIPPLIYNWAISLGSWAFLTPWVMTRREEVSKLWRIYRREAIAIGILAPLAYLLVLSALVFSPVSYVAPAREVGVLFGALMGSRLLGEGDAKRRLTAAGTMVMGIILLALG